MNVLFLCVQLSNKRAKKQHQSLETGCDPQSLVGAEAPVNVLGEVRAVGSCSVPEAEVFPVDDSAGLQKHEQPFLSSRSGPVEDMETHDDDEDVQHLKKHMKHRNVISSSDEDIDTLKDHFWKDLEEGKLPEDFVYVDLYSSVCQY